MFRLIALNIQTTGLHPDSDNIIEIAALEIINGEPTGNNFYSLLNPQKVMISDEATQINGLSRNDIKNAPCFTDIAADLMQFIQGNHNTQPNLLMHNAAFTTQFFDYAMSEVNPDWTTLCAQAKIFDTMAMAKQLHLPAKLDDLCTYYTIPQSNQDFFAAEQRADLIRQVFSHLQSDIADQIRLQQHLQKVSTNKDTLFSSPSSPHRPTADTRKVHFITPVQRR